MTAIWSADGRLDEGRIRRRETLYTGMNGSLVERIWPYGTEESFIWKPQTNEGQQRREKWVYEHVLPGFPPVYPRLVASVPAVDGEGGGSLFEDLGELDHAFGESAATALVRRIAWWHSLAPAGMLAGGPVLAPKPRIGRMAEAIVRAWETSGGRLGESWGDAGELERLERLVSRVAALAREREWEAWEAAEGDVFSHGDLHLGNYALVRGELRVLDWEHVHPNIRYWDLYHVIDLSHPSFPKPVDAAVRERLLRAYAEEAAMRGGLSDEEAFRRGYREFAAVFSLWMLLLIEGDLRRGSAPWPEENLRSQLRETLASFEQNAGEL